MPFSLETIQDQYPSLREDLQRLWPNLTDPNRAPAFERYFGEGSSATYQSDPQTLIDFLTQQGFFEGLETVFDLGCGAGDFLKAIPVPAIGIDLSPGFVTNFNPDSRRKMILGVIDTPLEFPPEELRTSGAISILTLDRLAYPEVLLQNMAIFKKRALATILPINPVDDNPSLQGSGRIYTPPGNRIVPGNDAEEDRASLLKKLTAIWNQEVFEAIVPYQVLSSGDDQTYNLNLFYTL